MKLILVASRQLATYLVISADSGVMTRNGRSVRRNGAYSSWSRSPTSARRTPTTTRSGLLKSSIAAPSLRNSGLLATSNGTSVTSAIRRASSALVPTGTVLLMTMILGSSRGSAIDGGRYSPSSSGGTDDGDGLDRGSGQVAPLRPVTARPAAPIVTDAPGTPSTRTSEPGGGTRRACIIEGDPDFDKSDRDR